MIKRLVLPVVALTVIVTEGHAQIRASERGTVSQTVDGTTITIDYGRPQARGRDELYGGEIPWGKVWTPGANWATTIAVDEPVTINGHELPSGTYAVWFQVQPDEWTVILDPQPKRFHLMPPPEADNQIRFLLHPETRPHVEVLTWSFPAVRPTGATLEMAWGTASATFDIGVQPSRTLTVTSDFADRFTGSYTLNLRPPLGNGAVAFGITYENEHLVGHWEHPPSPRLGEFWLAPLGAGMFHPVELDDGEIFDIVTDLVLEFTPLEGRATTFELRALGDALWGSAERQE